MAGKARSDVSRRHSQGYLTERDTSEGGLAQLARPPAPDGNGSTVGVQPAARFDRVEAEPLPKKRGGSAGRSIAQRVAAARKGADARRRMKRAKRS
jgi:hypothetical protein